MDFLYYATIRLTHTNGIRMSLELTKKYLFALLNGISPPKTINKLIFRNRLLILMYHTVSLVPFNFQDWCVVDAAIFKKQLQYLSKHFDLLHLHDAVEKFEKGNLQRPTAVITFDDGYQSNYDIAFPILRELNIPATIFLTTGLIDTDDTLWLGRINTALANTPLKNLVWKSSDFKLETPEEKAVASKRIQHFIKELPYGTAQEQVKQLATRLGDDPACPISEDSPFRMLNAGSIKKMQESDLIVFGAHTHSHPILSSLSKEDQQSQIDMSLDRVKDLTGNACTLFAYPNGRQQDYNKETLDIMRRCNVEFAVTTIEEINRPATPRLELRRIGIGNKW